MNHIKVKDKDYLYRDSNNNSLINSDYESYKIYENLYKKKYKENERIQSLENQLCILKDDINEIKNLLTNFTNESK